MDCFSKILQFHHWLIITFVLIVHEEGDQYIQQSYPCYFDSICCPHGIFRCWGNWQSFWYWWRSPYLGRSSPIFYHLSFVLEVVQGPGAWWFLWWLRKETQWLDISSSLVEIWSLFSLFKYDVDIIWCQFVWRSLLWVYFYIITKVRKTCHAFH